MEHGRAAAILDELHAALAGVYAHGDTRAIRSLLTDDVEWQVPGHNAIAGVYRGIEQVLDYFARRARFAGGTLRLHPGEVLGGAGEHLAVLTDGSATIGGAEHRWSTVGLYRIRGGQIAACWLLPLDPAAFDRAWSIPAAAARATDGRATQPVLILTGAPGSGKTTVARALADRYERAVHVEADAFFRFIRSGRVPPWKPESRDQNEFVMRLASDTAVGYASQGYVTIIDGIVLPAWFLKPVSGWLRAAGHEVAYAVLRAPLEVCVDRVADRRDELSDPSVVEQLWRDFAELGELECHAIEIGEAEPEQVATLVANSWRDALLISAS